MQIQSNQNINFRGRDEVLFKLKMALEKAQYVKKLEKNASSKPLAASRIPSTTTEIKGLIEEAKQDKTFDEFVSGISEEEQKALQDVANKQTDLGIRAKGFSFFAQMFSNINNVNIEIILKTRAFLDSIKPSIKQKDFANSTQINEFKDILSYIQM